MADLRTIERESIRAFVQRAANDGYLSGRVLDYGCGLAPYVKEIESNGGEWFGFDRDHFPANVSKTNVGEGNPLRQLWDAILVTQVIQYEPFPRDFLNALSRSIVPRGYLVLTYPTNWPEVEPEDLHRFTKAGMERLLTEAGFEIVLHERRAHINAPCEVHDDLKSEFALGYGCVARA